MTRLRAHVRAVAAALIAVTAAANGPGAPPQKPSAPLPGAAPAPPPAAVKDAPTRAWDELLRAHVSGGLVDYDGVARDRAKLDALLAHVASRPATREERERDLAFLIDAYNATVVASVLRHGRPAKVLDVKGFFDGEKHAIAGRSWTLNELETHIRKTYGDPRIHFALNCAARSCPPLRARAFSQVSLDATLSDLTRAFLDGDGVRVDAGKKQVVVSKLFEWYGTDFEAKEGSVTSYLKKWATEPSRKAALDAGYAIVFQDYDWTLNTK